MNKLKGKKWLFVLIFYLLIRIFLDLTEAALFINILNPIIWSLIIIYLIKYKKNNYFQTFLNNKTFLYISIMLIVFIFSYYYMGIKVGFTKSPYSHKTIDALINLITTTIPIIGMEWVRNNLIVNNKKNKKGLIVITIIFIFCGIDYNALENILFNNQELFKYICSNLFPIVFSNILYTYLVLNNINILPLIFRILVNLILILTPIIPNINWFMKGSMELVIIGFIYIFFKYKVIKNSKEYKKKREGRTTKINNILVLSLSIILICFMLGVFKYEPIAILSNSMVPTLTRGDVLIFKKLTEEELLDIKVGTIIVYKKDGKNISHRVIKRHKLSNEVFYITKGDNNLSYDFEEVKTKDILGVYVLHIKYIGFPTVWLNEYFNE